MKANFRLMAVTLTLLSASLAGCIGGDDDTGGEYSGPINLVVFYDSTSGMVETSENNGQAGPTTGVELSFDFADTTSDDGEITKIILDPDDGSTPIEADPSDNAVISYTWLTHGVFETTLTAEDEEGNSHSIEVVVRIDMQITWSDSQTSSATMTFDATPDCEDEEPLADRITISSTVNNPGGGPFFGGGNSDVTWSLTNPDEEEISSSSGTIPDNGEETWDYTTRDISVGFWSLSVEVAENGDDVNVNNVVSIVYPEGSEDPVNPRTE
ncbi:MAG: PKD domain-containing protein [Candidatus Poseidoniaceae archaeon]